MRELRRTLAVFASTLLVLSTAACAFDTEELPPTPETEEVEHDLEAVSPDAEETEIEAVDEDDGDGRLQLQREALDEKRALGDVHRPTPDPWQGPTPDPWDPGSDDPQSVDGSK